jgi:hypothetical protein
MRERNRGDRRQDTRRPPARHCLAGSPAGRGSGMLIQHGRRRMRGPGDFTPVTKSHERARQGQAAGHGMLDLMDRPWERVCPAACTSSMLVTWPD